MSDKVHKFNNIYRYYNANILLVLANTTLLNKIHSTELSITLYGLRFLHIFYYSIQSPLLFYHVHPFCILHIVLCHHTLTSFMKIFSHKVLADINYLKLMYVPINSLTNEKCFSTMLM